MKRTFILLLLFLSFAYAFSFGVKQKNISSYCEKDFFYNKGTNVSYSYIYNVMFFGCKLRDKNEISKKITSNFYNSGTGHLLSISGLHVGAIALFVYFFISIILYLFLVRFDVKSFPFFYISVPVGLVASILYVCSIGFEIPRLRSLLMLSMAVSAFFLPIFKNKMFVLSIACSVVLFTFPGSLFSYSFYYSFIAVFALLFCKPKGFIKASFCVFLFLVPLNLYSSGTFNLFHIFTNAVIIPIFSFLYFPMALFMVGLMSLGFFWPAYTLDLLTNGLVWIIDGFASVGAMFNLNLSYINIIETGFLYALLFCLIYLFKNSRSFSSKKCTYFYCVVFCFVFFLIFYCSLTNNRQSLLINFSLEKKKGLSGSGDIVFGIVEDKTFILDTGPGGRISAETFKKIARRKIDTIDYLLISHGHLDHFGGIEELFDIVGIKKIIVPPFMLNKTLNLKLGSKIALACEGSVLYLDGGSVIRFHTPRCDKTSYEEELSFSLDTKVHFVTFLSDLKLNSNRKVLENLLDLDRPFKILQLAHHCSKYDNSYYGLSLFSPVFSFCNRPKSLFGSMFDLNKLDFPVFVTGICGDTKLELKKAGVFVSSEKCSNLSLHIP